MSNPTFNIHGNKEMSLEILRDNMVIVKDHTNNEEVEIPIDDFKAMMAFFHMSERVRK